MPQERRKGKTMKIKKFSNKFIQNLISSDDVMDEAVLRGYADSLPYEMSQADDVAASFGLTLEKWATEQKGFTVSDNFFIEEKWSFRFWLKPGVS